MSESETKRNRRDLAMLTGRGILPAELRSAPGMQRLEYVLSLEDPAGFLAEVATEELYLFIKDIGEHDAYELLPLATDEQVRGIVELEVWADREPKLERWVHWLDLARASDFETALRFVKLTDPGLIQLFLLRELRVFPKDLDIDTVPDELHVYDTPDGMFKVTIPRDAPLAERIPEILKLIWAADMDGARTIFQTAMFELPSAQQELMSRFHFGRLLDMGFPTPEESRDLFAWVDPAQEHTDVERTLAEADPIAPVSQGRVVQDLVLRGVEAPVLLAAALELLDEEARLRFGQAFTYLVNKVFVADVRDISRTDDLPVAADFATATLNLGLGYLASESPELASRCLERLWPERIFRVGFSLTAGLGRRARDLRIRAGSRLGLFPFSDPTDDVLDGLARPRPMIFEGLDQPGMATWRPFRTLDELRRCKDVVKEAEAVLDYFETELGYTPAALLEADLGGVGETDRRHLTFETLFRTVLANQLLVGELTFRALSRDQLATFLSEAFGKSGTPGEALSEALEAAAEMATERLVPWMRTAFEALYEALGRVRQGELDARFAAGLILVRKA